MTYQSPRDARVPVITTIQVLVVSCGSAYVAMPADITRGILDPQEVGPDRTVTADGVTYTMTDLVARLGLEHAGRSAEPKIVLCARREAAKAVYVDQLYGLVDVTRDQIHTLPMHFTGYPEPRQVHRYREVLTLRLPTDEIVGLREQNGTGPHLSHAQIFVPAVEVQQHEGPGQILAPQTFEGAAPAVQDPAVLAPRRFPGRGASAEAFADRLSKGGKLLARRGWNGGWGVDQPTQGGFPGRSLLRRVGACRGNAECIHHSARGTWSDSIVVGRLVPLVL